MTLDELRTALKLLDLSLTRLVKERYAQAPQHDYLADALLGIQDAVSELSEHMLAQHSAIERLKSRVNVIAERINLKG